MICPQCGFMMDAFDRQCPRCGGKGLTPTAQTPQAQSLQPPAVLAQPLQGAAPPVVSWLSVLGVAVLCLLGLGVVSVLLSKVGLNPGVASGLIVLASAGWVYSDAAQLEVEQGQLSAAFDMTPGMWALGCVLLWGVVFPSYLVARPIYQQIRQGSILPASVAYGMAIPQPRKPLNFVLVGIGTLVVMGATVSLLANQRAPLQTGFLTTPTQDKAAIEQQVLDAYNAQLRANGTGFSCNVVTLVKQDASNYTGVAQLSNGMSATVTVTIDQDDGKMVWKAQPVGIPYNMRPQDSPTIIDRLDAEDQRLREDFKRAADKISTTT